MQTLAQIKHMLEERGLRPKRSLGQNFLIDHNLIRKLVDSSGVRAGDLVLEVGPGTGTMTEELLARGCEVIACELDDGLAALNRDRFDNDRVTGIRATGSPGASPGNLCGRAEAAASPAQVAAQSGGEPVARFTLIHGDCLAGKHDVNPEIIKAIRGRPFALVANLPYGAGTPLMSTLLIDHPNCSLMAVTIQREVADRLTAKPGTKDFGPLAVIARSLCSIEKVATAPPECFWPRPDVTSAMVLLRRLPKPLTDNPKALSDFCRVLFTQRRKQLGSVLGKGIDWPAVAKAPGCEKIGPTLRAEQLSVEQILALRAATPS